MPPSNQNDEKNGGGGSSQSPVAFDPASLPTDRKLAARQSTFWRTNSELLLKHFSLEILNPQHNCDSRQSSPAIAIFNLVATVCGGGVLSLPLAFARAGIIPATLLMMFAAVISNFAMYILCSCARRTGGKSYSDCARNAFGRSAELASTGLLFLLLLFILVAYMVLVKDIWTGVVLHIFPGLKNFFAHSSGGQDLDDEAIFDEASDYMLIVVLLLVSPLLFKKDLHQLRHTCYVGFASLIILIVAVVTRAYQLNFVDSPGVFRRKVNWCGSVEDILFAFPIICLSFFSIYNVLSVHSALVNPTRSRVKLVLDGSIGTCLVLFYVVGLSGYLYAYDETKDNILLNFPLSFKMILLGRLGYGFTLMFGLPMVLLPCREALLTLPVKIREWRQQGSDDDTNDVEKVDDSIAMTTIEEGEQHVVNGVNFGAGGGGGGEGQPLLKTAMSYEAYRSAEFRAKLVPPTTSLSNSEDTADSTSAPSSTGGVEEKKSDTDNEKDENELAFVLSTIGLVVVTYILGVSVPGVAVVWSICGSSMALLIGFTIPAACYLKIRTHKRVNPRSVGAWALVTFSIVASVVCTAQTMAGL